MKKLLVFLLVLSVLSGMTGLVSAAAPDRGSAVVIYQPVEGKIGAGDQLVIDRLTSLGFKVTPVIDADCKTADAASAALMFIGESCSSGNIKGKFAASATPIFCCEMAAWEDIGYGSQVSVTVSKVPVKLSGDNEIVKGMSTKSFDLFKSDQTAIFINKETVTKDAVLIGEFEGHYAISAYDKGAELIDGSRAPARRASGFIYGQTAVEFTDATWELFEAVVNWLSPPPVIETTTAAPAKSAAAAAAPVPQTFDAVSGALALAVLSGTVLTVRKKLSK